METTPDQRTPLELKILEVWQEIQRLPYSAYFYRRDKERQLARLRRQHRRAKLVPQGNNSYSPVKI